MWVVDSDGERRLSSTFMGLLTPEETPEMVIDFPVTVLYPRPNPQPVTVTTVEELEALPNYTVIRDSMYEILQAWDEVPGARRWEQVGNSGHVRSASIMFPATVLYLRPTPEADRLEELKSGVRALVAGWRADGPDDSVKIFMDYLTDILDSHEAKS